MRYKLLIFITLLFVFVSCKKESMCDCLKSTGSTNVIYRDVKDFNCIYLTDKMDLYLTQGTTYEVRVEAGENLQSLIKTELDGETLKVFNSNRCNWVRGYKHKIKVFVTAPYFKYLKNGGLGVIESLNTIYQDTISLRIENSGDFKLDVNCYRVISSAHGNGDLYLKGQTNLLESYYYGTNYLYANYLKVNSYLFLSSNSLGHAHINAPENGLMDIRINRAGNVYYKGNPNTINLTRNGKGNLIKE